VDLDSGTVQVLLRHRVHQEGRRQQWGDAYVDHGLVFARPDGAPIPPEYVTRGGPPGRRARYGARPQGAARFRGRLV